MIRKLWLIFAQSVTVMLAAFFIIATLRPEWLTQSAQSLFRSGPDFGGSALTPAPLTLAIPAGRNEALGRAGFSDAARRALPSVVHIFTSKEVKAPKSPLSPFFNDPLFRHFFGDQLDSETRRTSGLGSGVIVSANGYILTNFHVVERASEIEVALADGRKLSAKLVGADPESDIAVLLVKADKLPAITFGNDSTALVGDAVLAIGNPFGVGQTVTMGIVSALGRSHLGINTFENFIQTDAAINPGNSGGALTDAQGNLLGINTAIYSQSGGSLGIGFAIPASSAKRVMDEIIQHGQVTRGWIGVEAQEVTPELAESFGLPVTTRGALISGVLRASPADLSGLRPGDILQMVGGKTVTDPETMLDLIAALRPGDEISFSVLRERKTMQFTLKVGKRPPPVKRGEN
jgi:Do/DeqQ family serine protease